MSNTSLYTIGELAELASVTPRTIRYYTAEGLLPRPDARGQYALYSEDHLLRLRLIGRLKDAYLPLSEIKAQIDHLSAEEIRALLAEDVQPQPSPPSSAADYLAQVLNRPSGTSALAEAGEQYRLSLSPGAPVSAAPATMQLPEPQAPPPPAAAPRPVYGFAAPAEQAAQPAQSAQRPRLLHRLLSQRREQSTPAPEAEPAGEHWRRIQLAPGVELHLREPLTAALRERVEQLIALARGLFEGETH